MLIVIIVTINRLAICLIWLNSTFVIFIIIVDVYKKRSVRSYSYVLAIFDKVKVKKGVQQM